MIPDHQEVSAAPQDCASSLVGNVSVPLWILSVLSVNENI